MYIFYSYHRNISYERVQKCILCPKYIYAHENPFHQCRYWQNNMIVCFLKFFGCSFTECSEPIPIPALKYGIPSTFVYQLNSFYLYLVTIILCLGPKLNISAELII